MAMTHVEVQQIGELVRLHQAGFDRLLTEIQRVIVGQEELLRKMLVGLLSDGHILLEGVPGLAKTTAVACLARGIHTRFQRIQFTPDLLPADILGTMVFQPQDGSFAVKKGPIFANIVLADEVNRAPAKVQSALLEAMQERQVTISGESYPLEQPFLVLATQNPIEQEGTYPLPEAQLDRFMFKILVGYPSAEEEFRIAQMTSAPQEVAVERALTAREILELQELVRRVPCADPVIRYVLRLTRATRTEQEAVPQMVRDYVAWGVGPRASQFLVLAGKARAALQGRYYVSFDDIRAVAYPVLRHRVLTNFNAEADGVRSEQVVEHLLSTLPAEPGAHLDPALTRRVFATPSPRAPEGT